MIRITLLTAVALLASCGNEQINVLTDRDPSASATYTVEFTADWNRTNFPTNFPDGAHFTGLIGGTHSVQVKFWEAGQLASRGIEMMAETGNKLALLKEVEVAKSEGAAEFVLSGGDIAASPGVVSLEFDINEANSLVSLVAMMAPSPDWFTGVRDLNLYDGTTGVWIDSVSVDLLLYDAGTDNGRRFTSGNSNTSPPGIISPLTSTAVDTNFVNGLHATSGNYIGRMVFTRLK